MSLARAAAVRNISIVMEGENEGSVIARSGLLAEQVLWQARATKQSVPVVIPRAAFLHLSLRVHPDACPERSRRGSREPKQSQQIIPSLIIIER